MTYEECMSSTSIEETMDSIDVRVQGVDYTVCVNDVFERLTVRKLVKFREGKALRKGCICECSCGRFIGPRRVQMLFNGDLRSCGCYQRDIHSDQMTSRNFKHGDSFRNNRSKLYIIWAAMLDRSKNTNRWDAKYYASKGISVCEDWTDYAKFKDWALSNGYEEGLSIDRKDNSLGYEPSNCRWIPLLEQNGNKTSNVRITYNGETKILAEWSRITGISCDVLHRRMEKGLSSSEILGYN